MSQHFKFAPKEHPDLPLPGLDIYCHLSEMTINFLRTLCYFSVFWSPASASKIDGWGTLLGWEVLASANSALSHRHVQIRGCHGPSPSPLLNWPTLSWPNVIFLNWMELHLGRILRAIFPFYWKLFINPISKSESRSCIKYIQRRWEAIRLTKHIPW